MRDAELREKRKLDSENEVRLGMLKNHLADNGFVLSEVDLNASFGASRDRLHDLQLKLQQTIRQHEEMEMGLQEILREKGRCRAEVDDAEFGIGVDEKCSGSF
ncbi:hypothetical protein FRC02_003802 [Tulasnella sp. 418]|nr:hypothetical protein FRC02_003802 [Tulasnella sp. 418]